MSRKTARKNSVVKGFLLILLAAFILFCVIWIVLHPYDEPAYGNAVFVQGQEGEACRYFM